MANKNDYNYYKSEYSKFKQNNYVPANNFNNNNNDKGKSLKRFIRAFLVFFVTFGIIAAAVFGGIKLYKSIAEKEKTVPTTVVEETTTEKANETTTEKPTETTTQEPTTTAPETTASAPSGKVTAGTTAYVKTPDGSGVYLRYNPTYGEWGYAHLSDGTRVDVSEISSDGLWAKSSNFDINGWVYMKYLVTSADSSATAEGTTAAAKSTSGSNAENLSFGDALTIFGNDTSRNLYMNCKINSTSNVNGIANYQNPDSKVIATFSNGQEVPIYSVRSGYGKTRVNGVETWIPTQYLDFVSWGHYR